MIVQTIASEAATISTSGGQQKDVNAFRGVLCKRAPIPRDSSSGCASTAINLGVRMIFGVPVRRIGCRANSRRSLEQTLISDQAPPGCEITGPKLCGYAPSGANCAVVRDPQ